MTSSTSIAALDGPQANRLIETVTVEKLVYGGQGLGRLSNGVVIFLDGVIPGETVEVQAALQGKSWKVLTQKRLSDSPERRTPPCHHADQCGGCHWQSLEDGLQRHWKAEIVKESLVRLGKIQNPPMVPMDEPLTASESLHYRQTVTWEIIPHAEAPQLAYHGQSASGTSETLIPIETCPVLPQPLQKVLNWFNENPSHFQALIQAIDMEEDVNDVKLRLKARCNQAEQVLLGLEYDDGLFEVDPENSEHPLKHWGQQAMAAGLPVVGWFGLAMNAMGYSAEAHWAGEKSLTDTIDERPFSYSLGHFMQTHPAVTSRLIAHIQQAVSEIPQGPFNTNRLLDLYSGIGLFGLSSLVKIHNSQHQINSDTPSDQDLEPLLLVGVEGEPTSLYWAEQNAETYGLATQSEWIENSVEGFVATEERTFDVAIVDPPRNGIKPFVLDWLSGHVENRLIYVSCNPTTLARDLKQLLTQGWALTRVQPMDMFPQTYHVETLVVLDRLPKAN